MPYTTIYRSSFRNVENALIHADIIKLSSYTESGSDIITLLEGAGCTIDTVNNSEYKLSTIRARTATIEFYSTQDVNINTFPFGDDNEWLVRVYHATTGFIFFTGFLVQDDLSEPFQPRPNKVRLLANDGLASLKDTSPTNLDGTIPRGHYALITYLYLCLLKTGLDLDIHVINAISVVQYPGESFLERTYLHSKSFEKEIGELEDAYTIIEKLLKEQCIITQHNGQWWIVRLPELENNTNHEVTEYRAGAFYNSYAIQLNKSIGEAEEMYLSMEAAEVGILRPKKFTRENFDFTYPQEIIDNIDFTRGAFIGAINVPDGAAYTIDDWMYAKSSGPVDRTPYIKRIFEDGYEKERYVVLPVGNPAQYYLKSNPFPIQKGDKFTISIDARYATSAFTDGEDFMLKVVLRTPNNFTWLLRAGEGNDKPEWIQALDTQSYHVTYNYDNQDETEWVTVSADAPSIPFSGYLEIWLMHSLVVEQSDKHYANLQFEYKPFINGSYQKYSGQYHKITLGGNRKAVYEENIYVSDSPRELFKGALLVKSGWRRVYQGAVRFFSGFPNGTIAINRGLFPQYATYIKVGGRIRIVNGGSNSGEFIINDIGGGADVAFYVTTPVTTGDFSNASVEVEDYILATRFYDASKYPNGYQNPTEQFPYGRLQVMDVNRGHNRHFRQLDITVQGIESNSTPPDLIHQFYLTDASITTNNKVFSLLHYTMDLYLCEWKGSVVESFEEGAGPVDLETYEFKYVESR